VAAKHIQPGGRLIALDILPMEPLPGVDFIQGDFREEAVLHQLEERLAGRQVDLVLSDMAPNLSGISMVDQARVSLLAELTLAFCADNLKPGGNLLIKAFQGSGFMDLRAAMMEMFQTVQVKKPSASRGRSPESFLLARGKQG
jgi:23S rRNA (uridine2552-2'-O)-methyltransferase